MRCTSTCVDILLCLSWGDVVKQCFREQRKHSSRVSGRDSSGHHPEHCATSCTGLPETCAEAACPSAGYFLFRRYQKWRADKKQTEYITKVEGP